MAVSQSIELSSLIDDKERVMNYAHYAYSIRNLRGKARKTLKEGIGLLLTDISRVFSFIFGQKFVQVLPIRLFRGHK